MLRSAVKSRGLATLVSGGALLLALCAGRVAAQNGLPGVGVPGVVSSYSFALRHQSADEAMALVRPLLSPSGHIELAPDSRTLVIHDNLAVLGRVVPLLRAFDHPAEMVALRLQLVQAGRHEAGVGVPGLATVQPQVSPAPPQLEGDLVERLRSLLSFDTYSLLSEARLETREGDQVAYEFRAGYRVEFRLGTVVPGQRLKLHGFRVLRNAPSAPSKELIHTSVNLPLAQPFILGLTRDEGSRSALLVVMSYEPAEGN